MEKINFKVKEKTKTNFLMGLGIKEIYPPIENLEVTPTKEQQVFTHENSYGYDEVVVNAIPDEYIIPEGMLPITENKTYDVTKYARVSASVYPALNLQDKELTINENGTHIITADKDYDALNQVSVTVDAIENLEEELKTYSDELEEQNVTLDDITKALRNKANGAIVTDYKPIYLKFTEYNGVDLGTTVSNLDTSELTNMNAMFRDCRNLKSLDLSSWDTSKVTSMISMCNGCYVIETINAKGLDTSNVTNMNGMFFSCNKLTKIDGIEDFNTSKVTDMSIMFRNDTKLTTLDLSKWDTSNVTNMSSMFDGCRGLTLLDVSHFNTSKVTKMSVMFSGIKLNTINISNFDTQKVTDFSQMFSGCSNFIELDLSHFNTALATTTYYTFYNCTSLTKLNLSNWDTSKVTNSQCVFRNCSALTTLILDTPNVFKITNTNSFQSSGIASGICSIYVPDDLVDAYKADAYWGVYANQIKPISEYMEV